MLARRALALAVGAGVFAGGGGAACGDRSPSRAAHVVVVEDPALQSADDAPPTSDDPNVTLLRSTLAAPERDPARIAFTLDARAASTHIDAMFDQRDGWSFRWPDRRADPMRIWIQEATLPRDRRPWVALVREAFTEWESLGLPFIFTFTPDSARAEILVTWTERFDGPMTGVTRWRHDQHGWILGGSIELSLRLPDGRPVADDGIRAVARHEVGHLLGLDHVDDPTSIMAPHVRVTTLSEADRLTARLVYDLPPGRLRP